MVTIGRYEYIQIFGDSIVDENRVDAYRQTIINLRTAFAGGSAAANPSYSEGTRVTVPTTDVAAGWLTYKNSGVGGDQIADVYTRMLTQIDPKTTCLGLAVGINDATANTPTASPAFLASYTAALNLALAAGIPAAKIWCVNIAGHGDQLPEWCAADVDRINPLIPQAMAAAATPIPSGNLVDLRTPRNAYELANNPGNVDDCIAFLGINGCGTGPSAHPNATGIYQIWTPNVMKVFGYDWSR